MDWFHWTMWAMACVIAVTFPLAVAIAARRRDWARVFSLCVDVALLAALAFAGLAPAAEKRYPGVRWLVAVLGVLYLLNWFGLLGRLLGRIRSRQNGRISQ